MAQRPHGEVVTHIIERDTQRTRYGPGVEVPVRFAVRVDDPQQPCIVTVSLSIQPTPAALHRQPKPLRLTSARFEPREPGGSLTSSDMRHVHLSHDAEHALRAALIIPEVVDDEVRAQREREAIARFRGQQLARGQGGRQPLSDQDRGRILALWAKRGTERGVAQEIASIIGVSKTTVYRVIRESKGG